jgi:predicted transcriptional regulator
VLGKFVDIDLGPESVSNTEMGYIYEELVRRFSELSNETAGEHFTPREVVELMVNLLFIEDDDLLRKPGTVKTMLDPACGTGGMLSVSEQYLRIAHRQPIFAGWYNPGYTGVMKTAVSIPDELFESAEGLARRLGMTRSELYAKALRDYLREHRGDGITERLDEVYGAEEEGGLDPVVARLQGRSLPEDEW